MYFWFDLTSVQLLPMGQENGLSGGGDASIISLLSQIKLQRFTCLHRGWDHAPSLMGFPQPILSVHYSHTALSFSFILSNSDGNGSLLWRSSPIWSILGYYRWGTYVNRFKTRTQLCLWGYPPPVNCANLWHEIMMKNNTDFWRRQKNTHLTFLSQQYPLVRSLTGLMDLFG